MTLMLASVLSSKEAEIALGGGVDVIDCKDLTRGALGALPVAEIEAIVKAVAGREPVSAVVELPHDAARASAAIEAVAATGVDFVKFAVPMTPDARAIVADMAPLAAKLKLVAVLFADLDPDFGFCFARRRGLPWRDARHGAQGARAPARLQGAGRAQRICPQLSRAKSRRRAGRLAGGARRAAPPRAEPRTSSAFAARCARPGIDAAGCRLLRWR